MIDNIYLIGGGGILILMILGFFVIRKFKATRAMETLEEKEYKKDTRPKTITSKFKYFFIGGMVLLVIAYPFVLGQGSLPMLMFMVGIGGMISIGMPLGFIFLEPRQRCKMLRQMTKKNFGIVTIVKGKELYSQMKNFDRDTLEIGNGWYHLERGRIYQDKGVVTQLNDPDKIKFMGGIPTIFLDLDTITPLSFHKDKLKINPQEVSAPMKSELAIKKLELMKHLISTGGKLAIIVVIVGLGISAYYGYDTNARAKALEIIVNGIASHVAPVINATVK